MTSLLEKMKVIELSSVLAGPAVGMFFAELGAEVIKIENKRTGGDVTRSWKLPSENSESNISAYFSSVNWGKKHLFLDLSDPNELGDCLNLIREADILITNFKHGDDVKFGLSFEDVKGINPSIIYGAISGFGPESERIAYDLILQAESGFMSMNGTKDSGPVKMPVAFIDLFAAHQLKEGILVALLKQQQSPGALKVEVSLYDAALASLANQATNWLMAKHLPKRIGSKHPNIAPYGELFVTEDKKLVTFAIGSNRQFKELCHELGADEILTNNKFQENHSRVEHRSELAELLKQYVLKRGADELIQKLTEKYVPTAKIKDLSEVLSEEGAQRLVLEEVVNEQMTRRLKSAVFTIRS